jgi:CheY-like chemotaxis protein
MSSPRVLIAEDEPELRELLAEALEDPAYSICTAANGEEALTLLKRHPAIEVLLSDIRMPVMDGYILAGASLDLRPELKILLMTGYEEHPPPELLLAREIRTLHKPIRIERLQEILAAMLDRP